MHSRLKIGLRLDLQIPFQHQYTIYNLYSLRLQTCNNKRSDVNMQNGWRQDGSICLNVTQRINKKKTKRKLIHTPEGNSC